MKIMFSRRNLFVLLFFFNFRAFAETENFNGHLKLTSLATHYSENSAQDQLGYQDSADAEGDLRLNFSKNSNSFRYIIEGELLGIVEGDRAKKNSLGFQLFPSTRDARSDGNRMFDFSKQFASEGDFSSVARLDRLSIQWTSEPVTVSVGRQAVSWGQGMAFQALDFFNPFAPAAIDKEYKPGDDIALSTIELDQDSALQLIYVARRDPITHSLSDDQGSYGARLSKQFPENNFDLHAIAAEHYEDRILGIGASLDFLSAIWRADLSFSKTAGDSNVVQFVTNIDRSWELFDKNWYGFIEYFYNGFGQSDTDYGTISSDLSSRLARGDLYSVGRNYLALGMRQELTALLNLHQLVLVNLSDNSQLFQLQGVYDLTEDIRLTVAANYGVGDANSEFQGVELPFSPSISRGDSLFFQLAYYY